MQARLVTPPFNAYPAPQTKKPGVDKNVRFGGLGPFVFLDKLENAFMSLIVTDVGGMGIPRTTTEYIKRGPDAARENFIRDFSGTFFNMFVIGIFSQALLKLWGGKKSILNPKGMQHSRWINAEAADAFGQIALDVLRKETTSSNFRDQFYGAVIRSLHSSDVSKAPYMMEQALSGSGHTMQKSPSDTLVKLFREAAQGTPATFDPPKWHQKLKGKLPDFTPPTDNSLLTKIDTEAKLNRLLSRQVDLTYKLNYGPDAGKTITLASRGRQSLLKQLHYFDEQVLGRALQEAEQYAQMPGQYWNEGMAKALYAPRQSGLLAKIFPRAKDGLIDYVVKSKRWFTILPLILTISSAVSIAFLNNYLTKRKNGGKNYFPGEGRQVATNNIPTSTTPTSGLPPGQRLAASQGMFSHIKQLQQSGGTTR